MGEFNEGYYLVLGMLAVAVIGAVAEIAAAVSRYWKAEIERYGDLP